MNGDDRQDKIDRKRGKLNHGFQVLPRRTASILMEINNNGECRAVTSLDDSNIAAPISSDKKVCVAQLFLLNILLILFICDSYAISWLSCIGKTHLNTLALHCQNV